MLQEPGHSVHDYTQLFQQGNEKGLSFFYHEFHPALTHFANHWLQNHLIAEEIASEALVKAWKMHEKLGRYEGIRAYLYKIVLRDCRRMLKKERNRMQVQAVQLSEATASTPFDNLVRSETYRLVHSAIKNLSPGNRRVITMHFLEGKTTGQIAKELNLHPHTVQTQKARSLKALRKIIQRPTLPFLFLLVKIFFRSM